LQSNQRVKVHAGSSSVAMWYKHTHADTKPGPVYDYEYEQYYDL